MKKLYLFILFAITFIACKQKITVKENTSSNPFYDIAFTYREAGKEDSAFLYFNKAKELFLQQKNRFGAGKCLVNMAIISTNKGDNYGGQEISVNAIAFLDGKNNDHHTYIKSNFNNLGITASNLKEYELAIKFYTQALKYTTDSTDNLVVKNNIALAYRNQKKYKTSLTIFGKILAKEVSDLKILAKLTSNYNYTKWLANPNYNAAPQLLKALKIRKTINDKLGQNASNAELCNYYAKSQPDSALYYAKEMYKVATEINSADDKLEALEKLINFDNSNNTKPYFKIYKVLDDSLRTARSAAKNQFALIRYESEKNKADNFKLQQDNTQKKYEIIQRNIIICGIIILTIGGVIFTYNSFKKRKQKIESDALKSIQDNRLKTSKKIHDVVANGLYRVMTEIENRNYIDKDEVLDRLDIMYQKSRDISYEVEEIITADEPLNQKFTRLFDSFKTPEINIVIKGNTPDFWLNTSPVVRLELEHVLQELMVNMRRHSKATLVEINFEKTENHLKINYLDNGVGIKKPLNFNNGLTNTGNRIDFINGKITFDTNIESGLRIKISVPLT